MVKAGGQVECAEGIRAGEADFGDALFDRTDAVLRRKGDCVEGAVVKT
jgi:hypothetical protein